VSLTPEQMAQIAMLLGGGSQPGLYPVTPDPVQQQSALMAYGLPGYGTNEGEYGKNLTQFGKVNNELSDYMTAAQTGLKGFAAGAFDPVVEYTPADKNAVAAYNNINQYAESPGTLRYEISQMLRDRKFPEEIITILNSAYNYSDEDVANDPEIARVREAVQNAVVKANELDINSTSEIDQITKAVNAVVNEYQLAQPIFRGVEAGTVEFGVDGTPRWRQERDSEASEWFRSRGLPTPAEVYSRQNLLDSDPAWAAREKERDRLDVVHRTARKELENLTPRSRNVQERAYWMGQSPNQNEIAMQLLQNSEGSNYQPSSSSPDNEFATPAGYNDYQLAALADAGLEFGNDEIAKQPSRRSAPVGLAGAYGYNDYRLASLADAGLRPGAGGSPSGGTSQPPSQPPSQSPERNFRDEAQAGLASRDKRMAKAFYDISQAKRSEMASSQLAAAKLGLQDRKKRRDARVLESLARSGRTPLGDALSARMQQLYLGGGVPGF